MLKITRWRPDTCGCELYFQWDDESPEDARVHTPLERHPDGKGGHFETKRCKMHENHSDVHQLHNHVQLHNKANNNKDRAVN